MSDMVINPLTNKLSKEVANPVGRETIEYWDSIHKCKVTVYKDEFLKELYKGFSIGIEQAMEYGA